MDDGIASKERYKIERCRRSLLLGGSGESGTGAASNRTVEDSSAASLKYCSPRRLSPARRGEVERGEIYSSLPPIPMANGALLAICQLSLSPTPTPMPTPTLTPTLTGALFAVSSSLARLLAGPAAIPRQWLERFKRTELIAFARSRRRMPFKLKDAGCWPNGDATFGVWVLLLGMERPALRISLIDMPLWVSSHPEPETTPSRAFGNSSIVLHGLKDNTTNWLWEYAQRRGAGPYEPPPFRTCNTCRKMGWAAFPGSVTKAWRCCGGKVRRRAIRLDPRTMDEGMNSTAWWREVQRLAGGRTHTRR